jgi:membrane associated rhomboid family serine protease
MGKERSPARLLSAVARVFGRRATASLAILLGSLLILVTCGMVVVTVMSMGGGFFIGYVAAGAAFFSTIGSWIITRTIQWLRTTNQRPPR